MTKLSDTQLVLLSAASQRADGIIPISERLKGRVATAVGEKLIALGLAEERSSSLPPRDWSDDAEGQKILLVITARGRAAIGVDDGDGLSAPNSSCVTDGMHSSGTTMSCRGKAPPSENRALPEAGAALLRTKRAQVIDLLQRNEGATLDEIMVLTNWLPHTSRAALTGLRKAGNDIETIRQNGSATRYRIAQPVNGAGT